MLLSEEQLEAFEAAAKPLMEYLAQNHNSHTVVIVEAGSADILSSSARVLNEEFAKRSDNESIGFNERFINIPKLVSEEDVIKWRLLLKASWGVRNKFLTSLEKKYA